MIVVSNDITTNMSTNGPASEPMGTTCTGIHNTYVCMQLYVYDIQRKNLMGEKLLL